MLSAVTTFSACLRRSIWYVAVCYLRVCVPDVPVCGMFGCELHNQTFQRQVHQARTHIDNIQPHKNKRRKQAEKVVIALARRTTS